MTNSDMPLISHLEELRGTLIRIAVATVVCFAGVWLFHEKVFEFLSRPVMKGLSAHGIYTLQALHVTEGIIIYMKASGVAAVVLASPYLIWQIWKFVAPGLRLEERRAVTMTGILAILFFGLGVGFSYTIFVPMVVDFLAGFGQDTGSLVLAPTIENTFGMAIFFLVAFGLSFELPLIMLIIGVARISTPRRLVSAAPWFIAGSFIVAAVFTPPEPISQTLMATPLVLLYLLGILLAWVGWKTGDRNKTGAIVAAGIAILLFSGGIVTASIYFHSRPITPGTAINEPAQKGNGTVTVTLDRKCSKTMTPWNLSEGRKLTVSIKPLAAGLSQVLVTGLDSLEPSEQKPGRGPVGQFIREYDDSTWSSQRNNRTVLMITAPTERTVLFTKKLIQAVSRSCSQPDEKLK